MKITLETFKRLFNVKKGGAEFFRLLIKFLVWVFILGAFFYGLVWVPNQMLNIQIAKSNIEVVRVQRTCEANARNATLIALEAAKKEKKEISKEQEQNYLIQTYNNCVLLQGMDFLISKPQQVVENDKKNSNKK